MALALLRGQVHHHDIEAGIQDDAVRALTRRVRVVEDPAASAAWPKQAPARIAIMAGGRRFERALIAGAAGETVGDLAANHPEIDVPPMLHALALLGAIEIVRSLPSRSPSLPPSAGIAQLDVDAVRERVRARRDLVDDGDYFSLLGVPRKATSYDIRRAFSALRREFDPSRMLTPAIADLADDLRKIVAVLEEAYEVLGDSARRERYRRAIEDVPPR